MVIYNCKLKFLWSQYNTVMLLGFIFTRFASLASTTVRHEKIHCRQFWECFAMAMLLWPVSWWFVLLSLSLFYILYGSECLISRLKNGNWRDAYKNSAFEMEAKQNENDPDYLAGRSFFAFIRYYGKI